MTEQSWKGCRDLSSKTFSLEKQLFPKQGCALGLHLRQIWFGVRNDNRKIKHKNNDNQIKFLKFTVYLYTLKTSENMYTISSTVTFFFNGFTAFSDLQTDRNKSKKDAEIKQSQPPK